MIDYESSYTDLVTHAASICAVSGIFCIKNQLPREKPDSLPTVVSDEEFRNVTAEHESAMGSSSLLMYVCLLYKMSQVCQPEQCWGLQKPKGRLQKTMNVLLLGLHRVQHAS